MNLLEPIYLSDVQRAPEGVCPNCGGSIYSPSYRCLRCERSHP